MEIFILYTSATAAILMGFGALILPINEITPPTWQYYHYFLRKPFNWSVFIGSAVWTVIIYFQQNSFPDWAITPLILSGLAVLMVYKMHQEVMFKAVDFPDFAKDISKLPLKDDMQLALISCSGVTKCYPLDYVVRHHVINDRFNDKIVSLTYCAMCRSIIPFDVTEIGPLFVASIKKGNMIVADRKTKTFFQQATFRSIIGNLHPSALNMITFQVLNWADVKKISPVPDVVSVTARDLRKFELPIHGIWGKIMDSEFVFGLSKKNRDNTFPARTPVIGIFDSSITDNLVYLKQDVLNKIVVQNNEHRFILVGINNAVNAYKIPEGNSNTKFAVQDNHIIDNNSGTIWDISGKFISGQTEENLETVAMSDEYWFSWKQYHPETALIRV
jgi:hypothetical protein